MIEQKNQRLRRIQKSVPKSTEVKRKVPASVKPGKKISKPKKIAKKSVTTKNEPSVKTKRRSVKKI